MCKLYAGAPELKSEAQWCNKLSKLHFGEKKKYFKLFYGIIMLLLFIQLAAPAHHSVAPNNTISFNILRTDITNQPYRP